jgi:hypothetical protein
VLAACGGLESGLATMVEPEVLRIEAKAFEVLVAAPEPVGIAAGIEKGDVREKGAACNNLSKT